ncbi:MAG: TetR/AcrR family transcriptional regulator [Myxococcales bacterium]|jgi:AcrR family transcriptional regulator
MARVTRSATVTASEQEVPVRTRVLRGAAEAFGRLGYGATAVEAILAEAGVSRRTFYKHFRSKEDVLRVLFDNSVGMLLSAVEDAGKRPAHASDRLEAAVEAYVRVHAKAGRLARVLLLEQFSPGSPLARQRDTAMARFAEVLSASVVRAGAPEPDPILVRGVVAGINEVAVQMAAAYADGEWDERRAKAAIMRILRALEPVC